MLQDYLANFRQLLGLAMIVMLSSGCASRSAVPPLEGYELVWSDEFDGTGFPDRTWAHRGTGKRGGGYAATDTVEMDGNGNLVLTAKQVGDRIHSAMISTAPFFSTTYGYFECRAKMHTQPGLRAAFWLQTRTIAKPMGDPGSAGVEIDVFEFLNARRPRLNHALHWDGYGEEHKVRNRVTTLRRSSDGWHTFGLLWTEQEYVFYVDGKETWRTSEAVSHAPEYLILSLEVAQWEGALEQSTLPDHFYVDYVRVYKPAQDSP